LSIFKRARPRLSLAAFAAHLVLTLAFSWPLPLHLGTHLTGPPGGDTGVYVWNQWVFRHELVDRHQLPLFTGEIFSLTRPANLSLHNYTIFQDLVALPLLGVFDVVTTFNIIYLLMVALSGYAMFRLAWHVTGRPVESWLAGALFAWCPRRRCRSSRCCCCASRSAGACGMRSHSARPSAGRRRQTRITRCTA
jgi:hypothetical protein